VWLGIDVKDVLSRAELTGDIKICEKELVVHFCPTRACAAKRT
jgi:hypothetical protein